MVRLPPLRALCRWWRCLGWAQGRGLGEGAACSGESVEKVVGSDDNVEKVVGCELVIVNLHS